jgi:hypothetical protein
VRAQIGKKAFRKKYGAKHPMRTCIKRNFTQVADAAGTAGESCQTELSLEGVLEFVGTYGDDPTDSLEYAMAECVAEAVDEILNPDTGVEDPDLDDE